MTLMADAPPVAAVPVWTIGPARLLAGVGQTGRVDARAHAALHGPLPVLDRRRLVEWSAAVNLTGRGGAAFPVSTKLAALPANGVHAVVVNGSESEPASAKDRVLMRMAPHLVLDGAIVVAAAVGAGEVVISVHDAVAAESLLAATRERGDCARVKVVRSTHGFVSGEIRAVLSHLSGAAALPPGRRHLPHHSGLDGKPTFVSNVETFAQLAVLARLGPAGFARTGLTTEPGTMLYTVGGAVGRPGVVEAPNGIPLGVLLDAAQAGPAAGVLLGGYHGAWVPPAPDIPLSAARVAALGGSLGAGVVLVMDPGTCALGEVARVAHWLAGESAKQCGPCMFGLPALAADLDAILRGDRAGQAAAHRHTALLPGRGACAHPDGAARFVRSALAHFDADVTAHLGGRGCGRPVRGLLPLSQQGVRS